MRPIRILRQWLGRLVHRPAELFEVAVSSGTLGIVGIDLINYGNPRVIPSTELLRDLAPELVWLGIVGAFAGLQLLALHLDDPGDERHPFLQSTKWLRMLAAGGLLIWYCILIWAVGITTGLARFQAMYGMAAGMCLYVVAHVLFRPVDKKQRG